MHFVDRGATTDRWGRERGLGWRGIASKPDSDSDAASGQSRSGRLRATQSARPFCTHAFQTWESGGEHRPNVLFGLQQSSRLFYSSKAIMASCGDGDVAT